MSHTTLQDRVVSALRDSPRGPLKAKELARFLDIPPSGYRALRKLLRHMEIQGELYRVKGRRYALPGKINLVVGVLSLTRNGDGFVAREGGERDVFVPSSLLDSSMDGDRVVARIEGRPKGRNPEGRVIKILSRAHPTVVGTFRETRKLSFVTPLHGRLFRDVLIPAGEGGGASSGDVVVVRITDFGDRKLNPMGEVERVLGPMTRPGVDILSILFGHGLELEFPRAVEEAAEKAMREWEGVEWAGRADRTALHVFTIDPMDARDHDDALSLEPSGDGCWEVGIHIADVSRFVARGSPLDEEALRRGTSVYLVDRVVPMLPLLLSSHLCSLKPGEDRAAVSLFVTLDAQASVLGHRLERTRIRSRHRLNYEEVQGVLRGEGSIDGRTDRDLRQLSLLARALRRQRRKRGSLDFDLPAARVILGSLGEPLDIQRIVQLESHRLIEDFMLLANEIVAREALQRKAPIPFRIHEPPTPDHLEELRRFLRTLGHSLPNRTPGAGDLQRILERVQGKPEAALVSTTILRSLPRARYQGKNLGHFGLGMDTYTHFTSPIRRYPDLMVHRVVVEVLVEGGTPPSEGGGAALEAACEHASLREHLAAEAERDSIDLKKAEFMEAHLGEVFSGTVSRVTSFGAFVLLDDFFVEGLLHVSSLEDDFYHLREKEHALVGERTGRRFRLGDPVRVQVSRVDRLERHIDFVPAGPPGGGRV